MSTGAATMTSTFPTWAETTFDEWQEIDDLGTMRIVNVHEDEESYQFEEHDEESEYCWISVQVRRGTLTDGYASLAGVGTLRSSDWHEVCEYLSPILDDLTTEAIDSMISNSLGAFA